MNLDELAQLYVTAFIKKHRIKTERKAPVEFHDHGFLIDIYEDWTPIQAFRKCSQVGVSLMLVLKALFAAKTKGYNVIYTLPSATFVRKFVPDKVDKVVRNNPILKEWMTGKDSTEQKQVGDRTIYFDSAYVTETQMAEADLGIALTSDLNIHDEENRSSLSIIDQYESRLDYSDYKGQWHISNPTFPNLGVSKWWQMSDQKHWFVKCSSGHEQFLAWEDNVDTEKGIYVCKKCHRELLRENRRRGRWVRKWRDKDVSGYWVNQLMAPWLSAKDLIRKEETQEPQVFYNFTLGRPYMGSDVIVDRDLILSNVTTKESSKLDVFIGVDVGLTKHVVAGTPTGVFAIFSTTDWDDIERFFNKYDAMMVIDALPDLTKPRELMEKYRGRVFINYYRSDRPDREIAVEKRDRERGVLLCDRNRAIQRVIDAFANHEVKFHLDQNDLTEYIEHWESMYKMVEEDRLGNPQVTWESSTGDDHFVHGSVYYWLAKEMGSREGAVIKGGEKPIKGRPSFEIDDEGKMPAEKFPIYEKPKKDWKYV